MNLLGNEIGHASRGDLEFQEFLGNFIRKDIRVNPLEKEQFILIEKNHVDDTWNHSVSLHIPHVAGMPVTFQIGDVVHTPDSRDGKVLGSIWMPNLVLFENNAPFAGFFVVKVDTGNKISYYIRQQLKGDRFK